MEGYETLISQFSNLLTYFSPPFVYVHDASNIRQSALVIQTVLQDLKEKPQTTLTTAFVDGIACFTPRLLYDTALNELASWTPLWNEGCNNWAGPSEYSGQRFDDSLDSFLHGLRALAASRHSEKIQPNGHSDKSKAKARATEDVETETRMLLVVQHAERLRENMPDLVVPLTRLAELAQVDITTIFISDLRWDQMKPPLGASPDPYYIEVQPLSKQAMLDQLSSLYPQEPPTHTSKIFDPDTYHPDLRPLYVHFLSTLYSICSPFTTDPDELAYIAAAHWPGFVQPLLDERQSVIAEGYDPPSFTPTEDARIRLTRLFTPTFTAALEALYPRLTSASAWAQANRPPKDILSYAPLQAPSVAARMPDDIKGPGLLESLSRMAKFILLAAFLASTNPAKSDMRMFGRGPDERKKRRRGGSRRVGAKNSAVKIAQRLLGPLAFPLDRLIAILGVLLEENDAETRPPAPEYTLPGEYTEMEISRVAIYAQVMELASMHLVHRTSPPDRLELSPTFRCGISYEVALSLARGLGITLNDLMWEPA